MGYYDRSKKVNVLLGKTLENVIVTTGHPKEYDSIVFICNDGKRYVMRHKRECCESVEINDIDNDLRVLIGSPIIMAEEVNNANEPPADGADCSYTWTFYKFATLKGYVTIRWFGTSNGYYSEDVDFEEMEDA